MKNIFANWKTSSIGFAAIVTGLTHLAFSIKNHSLTETDCSATLIAILTGVGLLAAGDAGAKPPTPPPPVTP